MQRDWHRDDNSVPDSEQCVDLDAKATYFEALPIRAWKQLAGDLPDKNTSLVVIATDGKCTFLHRGVQGHSWDDVKAIIYLRWNRTVIGWLPLGE